MTPATAPVPFLGTWKISKVEASRPDLPHPMAGITKITQDSDGVHMNSEATWSDGRAVKTSAVYKLDGNWYPVTGSPLADSVSVRVLEGGAFEASLRKGGVDIGTQRVTVSDNGRTLNADATFIGPEGTSGERLRRGSNSPVTRGNFARRGRSRFRPLSQGALLNPSRRRGYTAGYDADGSGSVFAPLICWIRLREDKRVIFFHTYERLVGYEQD